ncbi:MAG TPA: ubiquinol-cytochrome c reductase iron-sulfur subunit [candidate division Zixibacteria bacterium]|nr:ubiquinol-cytochrome c reductase iron-sulfur subunit [candidate division Zixibacteria bacterium]
MPEIDQSKRNLLGWLLKGGFIAFLGSVFYPIYRFVIPPASGEANVSQIKLPFKLEELLTDDKKSRIFKFGRELGIIIVTDKDEVKAFSAICTHLDCTVQYREDLGTIWCACHNGHYDLEGRNIAGPPPRPLKKFAVHIENATGEIFVSKT